MAHQNITLFAHKDSCSTNRDGLSLIGMVYLPFAMVVIILVPCYFSWHTETYLYCKHRNSIKLRNSLLLPNCSAQTCCTSTLGLSYFVFHSPTFTSNHLCRLLHSFTPLWGLQSPSEQKLIFQPITNCLVLIWWLPNHFNNWIPHYSNPLFYRGQYCKSTKTMHILCILKQALLV